MFLALGSVSRLPSDLRRRHKVEWKRAEIWENGCWTWFKCISMLLVAGIWSYKELITPGNNPMDGTTTNMIWLSINHWSRRRLITTAIHTYILIRLSVSLLGQQPTQTQPALLLQEFLVAGGKTVESVLSKKNNILKQCFCKGLKYPACVVDLCWPQSKYIC